MIFAVTGTPAQEMVIFKAQSAYKLNLDRLLPALKAMGTDKIWVEWKPLIADGARSWIRDSINNFPKIEISTLHPQRNKQVDFLCEVSHMLDWLLMTEDQRNKILSWFPGAIWREPAPYSDQLSEAFMFFGVWAFSKFRPVSDGVKYHVNEQIASQVYTLFLEPVVTGTLDFELTWTQNGETMTAKGKGRVT